MVGNKCKLCCFFIILKGQTVCCVFFLTAAAKANIWHVFLYLLLGVSTTASWHKYVKRVAAELPFMAVKINNHT